LEEPAAEADGGVMLDDLHHYLPMMTLAEWAIYFGGKFAALTDLEDAIEAEREAAGCPISQWCYAVPAHRTPLKGRRRKRVRLSTRPYRRRAAA
jgi:hypothetical protein